MSIELKAGNTELAVTQEGDPIRVQIPATGIDPIGVVKPAVPALNGMSVVLNYVASSESVAGVSLAIPDKADKTQEVAVRVGWKATTNTGDVIWSVKYKWLQLDTVVGGAEDGTVSMTETVTTITDGYMFASLMLPAPAPDDRVLVVQLIREGDELLDTCLGDAHVIGILFDFTAGITA